MSLLVQFKGGDDATTIAEDQLIGFFGSGGLGSSIALNGAYNSYTAVVNPTGTVNYGTLPNVRYLTSMTADIGTGSVPISAISGSLCTLHISITSGSALTRLQAVRLIAYDKDLGETIAPTGVSVKGFEQGSSTWTTMAGTGSPLLLTPHTGSAQLVHDYYVGISATPTISGAHNNIRLSLYTEWY